MIYRQGSYIPRIRLYNPPNRTISTRPISTPIRPLVPTPLSPILSTFPVAKRARLTQQSPIRMASTSTIASAEGLEQRDYGDYKLLQSFDINYAPVKVGKWRSEKTGLSVVVGSHQCESTFSMAVKSDTDEVSTYCEPRYQPGGYPYTDPTQTNGHFAIASESELTTS